MSNQLIETFQTEVPVNNGLWTVRTLNTASPSNNDLLESYSLNAIETLPTPFYIKGTCFEEMQNEVLITTTEELFLYLCEVLIRFDADPRHYQKEDYTFLIKMLIKSLVYLYQQIAIHTTEIEDLWHFVNNMVISGGAATLEDITSMLSVGAISPQEVVPKGSSLDDFIKQLLLTTFYPTFTPLSYSLTSNSASIVESGTISDLLLTANFNRGSINGNLSSGIWNPSLFQNYRSGAVTNIIIDSIDQNVDTTHTIYANQIVDGSNTYTSTITYATGPQPLDSDGNNYSTPEPAAIVSPTVTIQGKRKAFYGCPATIPAISSVLRTLSSLLNPSNGSTFTINIPAGTLNVVFGYPSTLRIVSSVKHVEGLNAEIKAVFTETAEHIEGANGYLDIAYRIYTYTPVVPFTQIATYTIII